MKQHSCISCDLFKDCLESDRFIPCRDWREHKREAGNHRKAKGKRNRGDTVLEETELLDNPGNAEPDRRG